MNIIKNVDNRVSLYKGVLGAIPIVGPMAAEVVGQIIPDQRLDRIESLLKLLEEKLKGIETEIIEKRFKSPEFVDLLEDGMQQAARALSEERRNYIASILKNSLSDDDIKYAERKKVLNILSQLSDPEIITLRYHALGVNPAEQQKFWKAHENVLLPARTHMGVPSEEAYDKEALQESYRAHLVNLGLLRITFKRPRRNELPEFDEKTGMIKARGHETTHLGRLVLRTIDIEIKQ